MAAWNDAPSAGGLGECAALVRSAEALRFSAPELAVQLARRALLVGAEPARSADVAQARSLSMRAQAVLASGLVRMSHYVDAVEPAFAALALAEGEGAAGLAATARLDLAACSREVGEPLLGCALLRPVLEATQLSPSVRAVALGRLVGCVAHVGRRDDIEDALTEADRLLAADDGLNPDVRRLERARLSVRTAAYHRWYGDTEDAADAAREGITQLNRVRGLRPETARLRAQLVLELVCALLDEGALEEAAAVSEAVLAEPVRATSAAAVGRLMLAVSTRVHLPSGRVDRGRGLLDQAVWVADRHGLDGLLADVLTAVSQLDEAAQRMGEALESLRTARAAEQRRLRSMSQAARHLLLEITPAKWDPKSVNALLREVLHAAGHQPATKDWHLVAQRVTQPPRQTTQPAAYTSTSSDLSWPVEQLAAPSTAGEPAAATSTSGQPATVTPEPPAEVPATAEPAVAATADEPAAVEETEAASTAVQTGDQQEELDAATGLLNKEGLIRRLRSVRNGERPVALTLVRLENYGASRFADPGTRPAAAADFELSELAGRVRDIAPENAELARSDGTELAVLLPHTTRDQAEEFAAAIESAWLGTANGHSISTGVVQSNPDAPSVDARALINAARHALTPAVGAPGQPLPSPAEDLADMDPGDTLRIGRAIISSLSIPTGSGGKRRAEEPADPPGPTPDSEPGYRSSTFEQTKAELASLMSALNAKKDPPPQAFEAASLPAPSRPTEDHPRNGTALPSQSIPTPPDPPEIPEPEPRPDIPDPPEPDPIPTPPGREPEPDTGPLTPPGDETSGIASLPVRRRGEALPRPDSPTTPTKSGDGAGTETRSARRRRGGLAAAFGARSDGTDPGTPDSRSTRPRMTLAAAFAADDDEDVPPADPTGNTAAQKATGYPLNWVTDRTTTHQTADRAASHTTNDAVDPATDSPADRPPDHTADRDTDRPANFATNHTAPWATGHAELRAIRRDTDPVVGETTSHAADRAVGDSADYAAGGRTDRTADAATDWTAGHRADPVADDATGNAPGQTAGRAVGRGAGYEAGGPTSHAAQETAGGTTDRPAADVIGGSADHARRSTNHTAEATADRTGETATSGPIGHRADPVADYGIDSILGRATGRAIGRDTDQAGGSTSRADETTGGTAGYATGGATDRTAGDVIGGVADYAAGRSANHAAETIGGTASHAAYEVTDRSAESATSGNAGYAAGGSVSHASQAAIDGSADQVTGRSANHAAAQTTDGTAGYLAHGRETEATTGRTTDHAADPATDHGRAADRTTHSADHAAHGADHVAYRADSATHSANSAAFSAPGHDAATDRTSGRAVDPVDLAVDRPSRQAGQFAIGQSADRESGQSVERVGRRAGDGSARHPEGTPGRRTTGPASAGEGRRESRAERSSGSTTIAGLLAEALAAYQETSDEPDPSPPQPVRDNDVNDFDRLFDWRYQSPASGRHRSPE